MPRVPAAALAAVEVAAVSDDETAFRAYREGADHQRESLGIVWPELGKLLARADEPRPAPHCAIAHTEDGEACQRESVARIALNGAPGCALAIEERAKRPGGYPLELVDPREWRE